jgi:AraC-like DNA-binding protein
VARPIPTDTRGIVDPAGMMRWVDFDRFPAGDVLDGLVEWFWSVAWDLPDGVVHDQQVLNHPAGNVSVGTLDDTGVPLDPAEGRVYGVMTGLSNRRLTAAGWTVAARTTVGGVGALLDVPAKSVVDTQLAFAQAFPEIDSQRVVDDVAATPDSASRVARLRDALVSVVERRDPQLVAEAREVVAVATAAETVRSIRRAEQLASLAGVSTRTLQRLFDHHVGVSPSFVIRRWRIIEAAESARDAHAHGRTWRGWADIAAELGYADQAHLTRDFRLHLGTTPAAYVSSLTT